MTEIPLLTIFYAIVLLVLALALILLYRLKNPRIISYPWPSPPPSSSSAPNKVILAGSFNPPHKGHLAMVEYLAQCHKEVILVVGVNPKKSYKVSPQARAELLERMVKPLPVQPGGSIRVAGAWCSLCFKYSGGFVSCSNRIQWNLKKLLSRNM